MCIAMASNNATQRLKLLRHPEHAQFLTIGLIGRLIGCITACV